MTDSPREIVKSFAQRQLAIIENYIAENYGVPEFKIHLTLNYAPRFTRSWGGTYGGGIPKIKLEVGSYVTACTIGTPMDETEYPHYAEDPVIGGLFGVHWTTACMMVLAHEAAHCLQFSGATRDFARAAFDVADIKETKSHGLLFQRIYADLRENLVNGKDFSHLAVNAREFSTRQASRDWYVEYEHFDQGKCLKYYRLSDNTLLGKLFRRPGCLIYHFNPHSNKWEISNFTKVNDARKHFFHV